MMIDSHTHTHLRSSEDLESMALAGVGGVVVCAFLPVKPSGPCTLTDLFAWLTDAENKRLAHHGLQAWTAVGIHPRCIPVEGMEAVLQETERLLANGAARVLGEVGLETGSHEEMDVLSRQLRLARKLDVPVVLHTPRANKPAMLARSLQLLRDEAVPPHRVVVDHLTPELVANVREAGALAGLTVQPGKLGAKDVATVIKQHGCDGLLVNSDLSPAASDPLAVPRVARSLRSMGFDPAVVESVTGANARSWLTT